MALVRAQNCSHVNLVDFLAPFRLLRDFFQLPQVHLAEGTEEHARYFELNWAIVVAILAFFEEKVAVFVRKDLDPAQELLALPDFISGGRHDKACVDHAVGVLHLVDIFNRIDLLNCVQIKNHAMGTDRDLEQIVEEIESFTSSSFDSCEVGFGHFSHLDVLYIVSFEHVADIKTVTLDFIE